MPVSNNMHTKKDQFHSLLLPLHFLLQLSGTAYAKYSANRILLHAEAIRKANREIYQLLIQKADYIPEELQSDILALLNHYTIWFIQFKEHKKVMKPSLGDEFIFRQLDDQSAFPKAAEEKILAYYRQLKKELAAEAQVKHS